MKISCKIIQDLSLLYHDGVCSEENKDYYTSYAITKTIERNGQKENAIYIYYADTL